MNENPYAAPSEYSLPGTQPSEDERIRRNHLNAELNIKGIGLLYFLGGILTIVSLLATNRNASQLPPGSAEATGYLIGTALVPLTFLILGYGLRKLNTFARIIAGILSTFGLLGFPIGTVISIFFLYCLFSKKGRFVTTAGYKEVIARTPHIKRKTSVVVWIFLALLIIFFVFGFVFVLMRQH
jgi:hypothetical protein